MSSRRFLFAVAFTLLSPTAAAAQAKPLALRPADATFPEEYTRIGSIRELADRRVLVLERQENQIYVVDLAAKTQARVGTKGDGPQEYRLPVAMVALPGDSTLVHDGMLHRLVLLAGAKPVATVPAQAKLFVNGEGQVRGTDPQGRVLFFFTPRNLGRAMDQGDSLYLVRIARTTGKADTLTRIRSPFGGPPGSANKSTPPGELAARPEAVRTRMMAPPISDQAVSFTDGWIAVARLDPYRVDWIDPAGAMHRGTTIAGGSTVLDLKEKRHYLAGLAAKDGKPAGEPGDIVNWLPALPPFWGYTTALFPAPDGRLLIERVPTAMQPAPHYDVVDRQGALRGTLTLKAGERILGFGTRSVYVATADDDGIETLRRHPWP